MHVVHIPFRSLTIWALVVLRDTADRAGADPVVPSTDLRLALAWLASVRPNEQSALDLFWADAIMTIASPTDYTRAYIRGLALSQRVDGLAHRMLVGSELLRETHRRWRQGMFEGPGEVQSHDYLKEKIAAYREEQKRRAALY